MFLVPVSRSGAVAPEFTRAFERLFDDTLDRFFGSGADDVSSLSARMPAIDVSETDKTYTVSVDLPGVAKDDVQVSIDGRRVSIDAETHVDQERKEGDRVIYRERSVSKFSRAFALPAEIDQTTSEAKLENGVLTLKLGKKSASHAAQLTVR